MSVYRSKLFFPTHTYESGIYAVVSFGLQQDKMLMRWLQVRLGNQLIATFEYRLTM